MFRSSSVLLLLAATTFTASAADMTTHPVPVAAPEQVSMFDWSGFHFGVQAGGALVGSHWSGFATPAFSTNGSGALVGGQVGYDKQFGNFVLGIEADIAAVSVDTHQQCSNAPGTVCSTKQNWVGTVRGRAGYALDRVLVYGTGGVAYTDYTFRQIVPFVQGWTGAGSRTGWTAGLGAEYALTRNWSLGAEWKYYDFGSARGTGGFAPKAVTFGETENTLVARINYRF